MLPLIPKEMQTFNQLRDKNAAKIAARIETNRTRRKHTVKETTCYRFDNDMNEVKYRCYTITL